jgi:hypothetical protein
LLTGSGETVPNRPNMATTRGYYRPPFEDVLVAWKDLLKQRGLSTDILWILEENLCFERDAETPGGVRLGFQTVFSNPPPDAAKATYHHFAEMEARMAFYRLGESQGCSICIQLCDAWLEPKNESEGYVRRDEWLISFFPGGQETIEEITDPKRWRERVVRGRPLSAVDFCMTLSALRELKAHGRVLSPDERFGLKILRTMQEI